MKSYSEWDNQATDGTKEIEQLAQEVTPQRAFCVATVNGQSDLTLIGLLSLKRIYDSPFSS